MEPEATSAGQNQRPSHSYAHHTPYPIHTWPKHHFKPQSSAMRYPFANRHRNWSSSIPPSNDNRKFEFNKSYRGRGRARGRGGIQPAGEDRQPNETMTGTRRVVVPSIVAHRAGPTIVVNKRPRVMAPPIVDTGKGKHRELDSHEKTTDPAIPVLEHVKLEDLAPPTLSFRSTPPIEDHPFRITVKRERSASPVTLPPTEQLSGAHRILLPVECQKTAPNWQSARQKWVPIAARSWAKSVRGEKKVVKTFVREDGLVLEWERIPPPDPPPQPDPPVVELTPTSTPPGEIDSETSSQPECPSPLGVNSHTRRALEFIYRFIETFNNAITLTTDYAIDVLVTLSTISSGQVTKQSGIGPDDAAKIVDHLRQKLGQDGLCAPITYDLLHLTDGAVLVTLHAHIVSMIFILDNTTLVVKSLQVVLRH